MSEPFTFHGTFDFKDWSFDITDEHQGKILEIFHNRIRGDLVGDDDIVRAMSDIAKEVAADAMNNVFGDVSDCAIDISPEGVTVELLVSGGLQPNNPRWVHSFDAWASHSYDAEYGKAIADSLRELADRIEAE